MSITASTNSQVATSKPMTFERARRRGRGGSHRRRSAPGCVCSRTAARSRRRHAWGPARRGLASSILAAKALRQRSRGRDTAPAPKAARPAEDCGCCGRPTPHRANTKAPQRRSREKEQMPPIDDVTGSSIVSYRVPTFACSCAPARRRSGLRSQLAHAPFNRSA